MRVTGIAAGLFALTLVALPVRIERAPSAADVVAAAVDGADRPCPARTTIVFNDAKAAPDDGDCMAPDLCNYKMFETCKRLGINLTDRICGQVTEGRKHSVASAFAATGV